MRYGIPSLANDRCGVNEKGAFALDRDAPIEDWIYAIEAIDHYYEWYRAATLIKLADYNTREQLRIFRSAIEEAVYCAR